MNMRQETVEHFDFSEVSKGGQHISHEDIRYLMVALRAEGAVTEEKFLHLARKPDKADGFVEMVESFRELSETVKISYPANVLVIWTDYVFKFMNITQDLTNHQVMMSLQGVIHCYVNDVEFDRTNRLNFDNLFGDTNGAWAIDSPPMKSSRNDHRRLVIEFLRCSPFDLIVPCHIIADANGVKESYIREKLGDWLHDTTLIDCQKKSILKANGFLPNGVM